MIGSLTVLLLLAAAVAGIAVATRFLDRPIPGLALAGFVLLSVLPYPRAFVANVTPLPLDHATFTRPWHVDGSGAPYNPYLNDIALQNLPWWKAVRVALKDGALPLRNRWNGCGTALAANSQSAAFSPFTLIGFLLPLAQAFTLQVAVKLLLAAAGMWLWLRELDVSKPSAFFAAVAFPLSFTFVPPWILYPPNSTVYCLWPWTLFLIERCRDEHRRGRAIAALTAAFVLTALAGHPESEAMGCLFTALWLAARWLAGDLPDALRLAGAVATAAAVAVGLTAFLLIPSVLAIAACNRLTIATRPYWQPLLSLMPHAPRWWGLPEVLFPHTLGNAVGSPLVPGGTGTFCEMAMGYIGIAGWTAALLAFRPGSSRRRAEWVLWGLLVCGLGQAVCLWPVGEIFAHIPGFRYIFPLRFNGWVALAAPAIAAFELDRHANDVRQGRTSPATGVLVPALLGLCGIALYVHMFGLRRATGGLRFQTWQLAAVLTVLGLCGLLALGTRSRPTLYTAGLTLLCGAELLYQWRGLNHLYSPALMFPETPLLRFLHAQPGIFRVAGVGSVLFPNSNVFAGLEDIRTHDPVERRDYTAFLDATCGYPYADYFKRIRDVDAPVLDFLNVRYLLADPGAPPPGARWHAVYSGTDGSVFENAQVLPRAFAPARVRFVPPPAPRIGPVLDAAAAFGASFREITSLRDWGALAFIAAPGSGDLENPPVAISDYREATNAVSFHARVTSGRGPGFVVLSLVQDGGWSARDEAGAGVPAFLANGPFLALRLPPGERRVELRYCPPGMRIGAGVSLATLGVLAIVAIGSRARRRPR